MVWRYWATLAEAYLQNFQYDEVLLVLNSQPFLLEDDFQKEFNEKLGLPNLKQAEQTVPQEDSKDHILWMKPDAFLAGSKDILAHNSFPGYGPNFGFHPKLDDTRICDDEVPDSEFNGHLSSEGNNLMPAESAAYKVLVAMYNDLGWDNLLVLRAQVFIMEEEDEDTVEYDEIVALGRQSREN